MRRIITLISAEVPLEAKLSKSKAGGAAIKMTVAMTYTPLPQVDSAVESGGMPASPLGYLAPVDAPPTDEGILKVT